MYKVELLRGYFAIVLVTEVYMREVDFTYNKGFEHWKRIFEKRCCWQIEITQAESA